MNQCIFSKKYEIFPRFYAILPGAIFVGGGGMTKFDPKHLFAHQNLPYYVIFGAVVLFITISLYAWEGIRWGKASYSEDMLRAARSGSSSGDGDDEVLRALAMLDTSDQQRFEQSVYAMERMGKRAVPGLIDVLKSAEASQRQQHNAIYISGRLGENARSAVPTLMRFLRDENPDTRAATAIALGKIGAPSSVDALSLLLFDKDKWVRKSVREALHRIDTDEAKEVLRQMQERKG